MNEGILVGSFTLGGAALGAAVGILGAYFLDTRRRQRERRAAVRLLRAELTTNSLVAEAVVEGQVLQPFQDSDWQGTRFHLALGLPLDLFIDIGQAYFMFPYYQSLMDDARGDRGLDSAQVRQIGRWGKQLDELLERLVPFQ
jgi:hypothetical protein